MLPGIFPGLCDLSCCTRPHLRQLAFGSHGIGDQALRTPKQGFDIDEYILTVIFVNIPV